MDRIQKQSTDIDTKWILLFLFIFTGRVRPVWAADWPASCPLGAGSDQVSSKLLNPVSGVWVSCSKIYY